MSDDERVRISKDVHRKLMEKKFMVFRKTGKNVSLSWIILQMINGKKFRRMG